MTQLKSAILVALLFVTTNVGAATLTFDYTVSGSVFSGVLSGTLQDDNDTFLVNQALELSLDGFTIDVSNSYVGLFSTLSDDLPDGVPIDPSINNIGIVSLSGQLIDLIICGRESCVVGVAITNGFVDIPESFFAFLSPTNTLSGNGFDESNWNAQVPLPMAGWLFLGALFGLRVFGQSK